MEDLLDEIINNFKENSSKQINLVSKGDNNKFYFQRSPEIIYGLRNFIGNAVKFGKSVIKISIISDKKTAAIKISDDGPGFPEDIIEIIGEPYIKSKSQKKNKKSGTGLGTFLGKTLLERTGAKLEFSNGNIMNGACVTITWKITNLTN